jgi:hypothetical protein
MQTKLYGVLALAALAGTVLLLPGLSVGQPPGGKGKGKGGGGFNMQDFGGKFGGGGMQIMGQGANFQQMMDPSKIFDQLSMGNDYVDINSMRMGKAQAMQWAQDNGITSGQLNRDQFEQYMNAQMAKMQGGGPGGGRTGGPMTPEQIDQTAERLFKLADKNQDGFLTEDEMSGSLRQVWQKWDFDGDGLINLEEYKMYFRDLQAKRQANNDGQLDVINKELEWEKRPTVYRYGHLPPQLPAWFSLYDTDKDGQVGLYEWRAAGQPVDRFQEMDRNGDGLLTVEEVLYFMKLHPEVYGPVTLDSETNFGNNNGWQQWQPPQQQQKGKGFGGPGGKGGPPGGYNNNGGQQQQPFMAAAPRGPGGPGNNPGKGKGKGNYDPNDPNSGGFGKKGKGGKGGGGGGGPGGD